MLLLRLSVFAFFIAAVVYLVRRFNPDDRRMFTSAGWALGTGLVVVLAILAESLGQTESTGNAIKTVKILGVLPLAGALWVVIYSGQLLGDEQGGYWFKREARTRDAVRWSLAAVTGLVAWNWVVCRYSAVTLSPSPAGQEAVARVLAHLGFSLAEEFFTRGCVQALLVGWFARFRGGRLTAVGVAATVFTAQHVAPLPELAMIILPAGVVFGLLFARFGLWSAIGVHFAANLAMTFLLPHLV